MRIEYNVLWFENEEGWLKPTKKNLTRYLDDFGFKLEAKIEKDNSNVVQILSDIKNNLLDVDVIFMDYKLAKEKKGDAIIQTIRKTELFTEIVFYSNKTNVKEVIENSLDNDGKKAGSIEGIYYSERDNFLDKAKTVIKHTIKKVQEVNSMRGLILASVSDLDEKMLSIIESTIVNNSKIGPKVADYAFKISKEFIENKSNGVKTYSANKDSLSLIKDTLVFDSYKKARVIQKILTLLKVPELNHLNNFCEDFNRQVIQPRNAFGHVTPQVRDGKKVLIPNRGEEIIFTDDECIKIRRLLMLHSDNIDLIKEKIG